MKNRDIFENALRILAQSSVAGDTEDYAERAPFLIADFCTEALDLNTRLCEATGKTPITEFERVWLPLEENFPLLDRLAPIACLYVAAMLILDEDDELSDKLYARFCDKLASVWKEIPALLESIKEKYFHK